MFHRRAASSRIDSEEATGSIVGAGHSRKELIIVIVEGGNTMSLELKTKIESLRNQLEQLRGYL